MSLVALTITMKRIDDLSFAWCSEPGSIYTSNGRHGNRHAPRCGRPTCDAVHRHRTGRLRSCRRGAGDSRGRPLGVRRAVRLDHERRLGAGGLADGQPPLVGALARPGGAAVLGRARAPRRPARPAARGGAPHGRPPAQRDQVAPRVRRLADRSRPTRGGASSRPPPSRAPDPRPDPVARRRLGGRRRADAAPRPDGGDWYGSDTSPPCPAWQDVAPPRARSER